ncbi:MAG: hypothetical protein IPP90_14145 [Gemmatimonadaceae bacterium]|nr:hypothetical protein [Gemmatimonadaceae bacterium]
MRRRRLGIRVALSLGTAIALVTGPVAVAAQSVGETAIRSIHARWHGKTYKTLTFVQETQFGDGRKEIWYESLKAPGLLRIDIAPGDANARLMLVRRDSMYQGRAGRNVVGRPFVHPLMVLFTDIAENDPATTIAKVVGLGIDLSRSRTDSYMGRPVTVIGAGVGDSISSQFWIENDRQLVVRLIEKEARPGAGIADTRVAQYARAGQGWVESEIVFYQGGRMAQRELYSEIKTDVPLDDTIFQPLLANVPAWIAARKK